MTPLTPALGKRFRRVYAHLRRRARRDGWTDDRMNARLARIYRAHLALMETA